MNAPPQPWPTGLSELCEPLVRRVLAPNPSPYTYTGTQTYIVGAGAEVAVIDPGPAGTGVEGHADTAGEGHVEPGTVAGVHRHIDPWPEVVVYPVSVRRGAAAACGGVTGVVRLLFRTPVRV